MTVSTLSSNYEVSWWVKPLQLWFPSYQTAPLVAAAAVSLENYMYWTVALTSVEF